MEEQQQQATPCQPEKIGPMSNATLDEWFAAHDRYRVAQGRYSDAGRWFTWISPRLGHLRWREVTAEHIEDLRDTLDSAILAWGQDGRGPGRIAGNTAMSVWSVLSRAVHAARASKQRDLRVFFGPNPMADIEPPGDATTRQDRRKTFIYPLEFLAVAQSSDVPLEWREAHSVAVYTYLRPAELYVLEWPDVDFRHRRIRVTRAISFRESREGRIKRPKTWAGVRDLPIHPNLLPLLQRMHSQRSSETELVLPVLRTRPRHVFAEVLRSHLRLARVLRPALHESTPTTVQANWRSWRDSGVTWAAIAGVNIYTIQRRAGHEDISTTSWYMKAAEDITGGLGAPFPVLPASLIDGTATRARRIVVGVPRCHRVGPGALPAARHSGTHFDACPRRTTD